MMQGWWGQKPAPGAGFRCSLESWHDVLREAAEEAAVERRAQRKDDFGRPGVREFAYPIANGARAVGEDRAGDLLLDDRPGAESDHGSRERNVGDRDQREQHRDVALAGAAADPAALLLHDVAPLPDPVRRDATHRVPAVAVAG